MRMVFGLVLILGLALAGFAVYMAQGYISQTQAELARERATLRQARAAVRRVHRHQGRWPMATC